MLRAQIYLPHLVTITNPLGSFNHSYHICLMTTPPVLFSCDGTQAPLPYNRVESHSTSYVGLVEIKVFKLTPTITNLRQFIIITMLSSQFFKLGLTKDIDSTQLKSAHSSLSLSQMVKTSPKFRIRIPNSLRRSSSSIKSPS